MSASAGLRLAARPERRVLVVRACVVAVSVLSPGLGYVLLEADDVEGVLTGPLVVAGSRLSLVRSAA